ncbi:hypothetical protein M3Y94_00398400 [Aphelenchoides besseyi]|nr:hypothetical protein M3Y94_00398400 [Aphelenchoides besseyi]
MSKSSHRPYSVDKFLQTDDLYPLEYADEQFEEELECAHYFSKDPNNQLLELVLIDFKDAKFCEKLTKNMKLHKITGPTPIQAFAIPQLLENHKQNFRISASPGSGKTLVYVLPIIDYIIRQKLALKYSLRKDAHLPPSRKAGHPFAVVILPTPATTIQLKSVLNSLRGAVGNFSICTLLKNSEDDESTKKKKRELRYCDWNVGNGDQLLLL